MNLETLKIVITAQTNQVQTEVAKAQRSINSLGNKTVAIKTKVSNTGMSALTGSTAYLEQLFSKLNIQGTGFVGTLTDMAQALSAMKVSSAAKSFEALGDSTAIKALKGELNDVNEALEYAQGYARNARDYASMSTGSVISDMRNASNAGAAEQDVNDLLARRANVNARLNAQREVEVASSVAGNKRVAGSIPIIGTRVDAVRQKVSILKTTWASSMYDMKAATEGLGGSFKRLIANMLDYVSKTRALDKISKLRDNTVFQPFNAAPLKTLKSTSFGGTAALDAQVVAAATATRQAAAGVSTEMAAVTTATTEAGVALGGTGTAAAGAGMSIAALTAVIVALIAAVVALAAVLSPAFVWAFGAALDAAAKKAIQFSSAVTNIKSTLEGSAPAFEKWMDDSALALGMSDSAIRSYGSQFSILTSQFTASAHDNAVATANLITTAAIVAAKTGRTTQDVMERFRSGMLGNTESIEDLGIQVGQKAIEASKGYKELGVKYDELAPKQKQYLYYAAIIEQTEQNYGKTVATGPALASQQWAAAIDNLKLVFSEGFLPVFTAFIGSLTKFMLYAAAAAKFAFYLAGGIVSVVKAMLMLLGVKFNKPANQTATAVKKTRVGLTGASVAANGVASGLGKAAKSAKEIRKTLAGFDEINNLGANPTTNTGGGAGTGGTGGITGGGNPDFGDFPVVTGTLPTIDEIFNGWKTEWDTFWAGVKNEWDSFWALFPSWDEFATNWNALWAGMADEAYLVWEQIKVEWNAFWRPLSDKFTEFKNACKVAWEDFKTSVGTIGPKFQEAWAAITLAFAPLKAWFATKKSEVVSGFNNLGTDVKAKFDDAWAKAKSVFSYSNVTAWFKNVKRWAVDTLKGLGKAVGGAVSTGFKTVMNVALDKAEKAINKVITLYNNVVRVVRKLPGLGNVPFMATVNIPSLARGGIVGSGQIYQAGEAGKEAIIPLENNTQWINKIADSMMSRMGGGIGDKPLTLILQVNETQLGRVTVNSINSLIKQNGVVPINI